MNTLSKHSPVKMNASFDYYQETQNRHKVLMEHHSLVLKRYNALISHDATYQDRNQVQQEFHQALHDHHQLVLDCQHAFHEHRQAMRERVVRLQAQQANWPGSRLRG